VADESDRAKEGQERFARFLKIFENMHATAAHSAVLSQKQIDVVGKLFEITNKSIEVNSLLFEAITRNKDGLIAAIDDLILETQGLREDLRAFAKAGSLQVTLGSLFGATPTRRRR
jgi:hypothetical protein